MQENNLRYPKYLTPLCFMSLTNLLDVSQVSTTFLATSKQCSDDLKTTWVQHGNM